MTPQDAVDAHLALGARVSIASHFGTFPLADDGDDEPIHRLRDALRNAELGETEFWLLNFGEGRELSGERRLQRPRGVAR
jgi:L-ascorbate metabolism protein UlaG (beta-lactamase superfamily)